MMHGLTWELGGIVARIGAQGSCAAARAAVIPCIIDTTATLIAGRDEPSVALLMQALSPLASGRADLLFGRGHASAGDAAFVNGVAAHVLDYDDVAMRGHPSTVLVPLVMALQQELGASDRQALDGYVAGYEIWGRVADRVQGMMHLKGWHPTGILGAVAASAAAAAMLQLDHASAANALGIGASQSAGIMSNFGSMTKSFHAGKAAQAGILSARLARVGYTASVDAIEHPHGLLQAVSSEGRRPDNAGAVLEEEYRICRTRPNIKRYPVCYYAHRAIDSLLMLRAQQPLRLEDVARIEVAMSQEHATVLRNHAPVDGLGAKFSIEFAMAAALIAGKVGLIELSTPFVQRRDVQQAMRRVHVVPVAADDPDLPGGARCDQVHLVMHCGTRLSGPAVRYAKGHALHPLTMQELRAKFDDALAYSSFDGDSTQLFDLLLAMDAEPVHRT